MSKPSIQNIVVSQTFQNWFDKTNEMVDIMRDSALTASALGDSTTGNATLVGDFTANTVTAFNTLRADTVTSKTAAATIQYSSPINITPALDVIGSTITHPNGGRARYTTGTTNWDVGLESSAGRFGIFNSSGTTVLGLSSNGIMTIGSVSVDTDVNVGGNVNVVGSVIAENVTANTMTISTEIVLDGILTGDLRGDIYHPSPTGGNGSGKVLENGGPASNIPATFYGNVSGTVSSLINHNTKSLAEDPTATVISKTMYFTNARAHNAFGPGTGVTISTNVNDPNVKLISIGQAVGTSSNVQFASVVATGNITAFFGTTSDIRVKENIEQITGALDKVSKINGYTFNHKGSDERMAGVVAQELLEVLPEAVFETKDPRTGEDIYAVRYDNIIGLLIEAIKELKEQVGK